MREKIEKVLAEIRPMVQKDGMEVELVEFSGEGMVTVRIKGACADCRDSMMSLAQGLERLLMEQVPEVKKVVVV